MVLTRERKLLAAIVGLGAIALFVDRVMLSDSHTGPSSAAANALAPDVSSVVVPLAVPQTHEPSAKEAAVKTAPSIADRLAEAARELSAEPSRDAFTPAPGWGGFTSPHAEAPAATATPATGRLQTFADTHKLSAIMAGSGGGVAIIDGRPLTLGQMMDGYKLVEIQPSAVTFEGVDGRIVLKLRAAR